MPPFVPPTIFCPLFALAIWYDSLNYSESFFWLGSVTRNLTGTKCHKNLFLHLTVHTLHLDIFPFKIIILSGDELVKSEQSTLHLCDFCARRFRRVRQWEGGKKVFLGFTVHTVHLSFLYSNFIMLSGDQSVKGEQSIVHPAGWSGIKRPAAAGLR